GLHAVDRLLGGVQIRLELFRARDARAGIALQRAARLVLLRGVLLELFRTRLRGRESLGLGAALMLCGLECAGPVLRLAPRAGPLLLELAEPAPFRRESRLELRIPRAHLGERLVVSSGRRRGGGRCGAHLGERLGELGALGPEPRELALLPRVAAALPDGDAGRRTRALAGGIGPGAQRGGALARRAARILLRSAQLGVALGQRGGERARLLLEAGDAGSALRELGLQFARARVTADHRPRDARQPALPPRSPGRVPARAAPRSARVHGHAHRAERRARPSTVRARGRAARRDARPPRAPRAPRRGRARSAGAARPYPSAAPVSRAAAR